MNKSTYTGRKIAIFTDAHSLLEPTEEALLDIKKRGIKEIYSLGDNIGVGPNPSEVIDLLREYNVISLAGNAEDYTTLGIEPFQIYFDKLKELSQTWTLSKLNEEQIGVIKLFPHSLELLVGGKNISLCHFGNDVRIDFLENNTWTYQNKIKRNEDGYKQFLNTNSKEQLEKIKYMIEKYGKDSPFIKGYLSSLNEPLFAGKRIDLFDAVIEGHVHWKLYEETDKTKYYSIRAVGMAYQEDPVDTASYVILHEKIDGYDLEEVLVKYDREKMIHSILSCDNPDKSIRKFTGISR